jgi:hypothetical protein
VVANHGVLRRRSAFAPFAGRRRACVFRWFSGFGRNRQGNVINGKGAGTLFWGRGQWHWKSLIRQKRKGLPETDYMAAWQYTSFVAKPLQYASQALAQNNHSHPSGIAGIYPKNNAIFFGLTDCLHNRCGCL